MFCIDVDLSERKRTEEALRKAHNELERRVEERTAELAKVNDKIRREIEERKRAEESLRESERRYFLATSAGRVGVWDWNLDTNEIYLDPMLKAFLGYEDHEIRNHIDDWGERVHPADQERVMAEATKHLEGASLHYEIEHRMLHKDGSIRWFLARGTAMRDKSGKPYRMLGTDTDITEHKQAEDALREREKRFSDIADNALEWIWETNTDGKYIFASPVVKKILGYEPEEMLDKHFYDLFHPEDREELRKAAFEVFARREPFREFVNRNTHKSGKEVWLSTSAVPMFDEEGNIMGYRGSDTDITDRKRSEEALRESATRLQLATAATRIGHWDWDLRTNEVYFSLEWKRQLGYQDHEIPNRFEEWESRLHPDDLQRTIKALEDYIAGRKADYAIEFRLRHKDASYRWIYTRAEKQFDDTGNPYLLFGCHVDITERKQAEEDVRQHREELSHVTRMATMGELAASLAHEINQPLTAIRSYAQAAQRLLVDDTPDLDEVGKILAGIVAGNRRAEEVIQRIRMVMKNEQLEWSRLDIKKFIKEVVSFVRKNAEEYKISLRLDLDAELPQIFGDRVQLQQVVLNLIINGLEAINAGEDGFRELVVRASKDEPDVVTISVRDSGTGIAEENKDRIFDSFFSTKSKGLGMGLSISRSIIEEHGGRLWATRNPDQGTTFSFTVPIYKENLR
jgi:PAS domain S-box-containing protein